MLKQTTLNFGPLCDVTGYLRDPGLKETDGATGKVSERSNALAWVPYVLKSTTVEVNMRQAIPEEKIRARELLKQRVQEFEASGRRIDEVDHTANRTYQESGTQDNRAVHQQVIESTKVRGRGRGYQIHRVKPSC